MRTKEFSFQRWKRSNGRIRFWGRERVKHEATRTRNSRPSSRIERANSQNISKKACSFGAWKTIGIVESRYSNSKYPIVARSVDFQRALHKIFSNKSGLFVRDLHWPESNLNPKSNNLSGPQLEKQSAKKCKRKMKFWWCTRVIWKLLRVLRHGKIYLDRIWKPMKFMSRYQLNSSSS